MSEAKNCWKSLEAGGRITTDLSVGRVRNGMTCFSRARVSSVSGIMSVMIWLSFCDLRMLAMMSWEFLSMPRWSGRRGGVSGGREDD